MTVAEFCTAEGVSQPSFYSWKRKLQSPRDPEVPAVAKFVPVSFQATLDRPSAMANHASATIELPGGVRIRVEVPTDSQPNALRKDLA